MSDDNLSDDNLNEFFKLGTELMVLFVILIAAINLSLSVVLYA